MSRSTGSYDLPDTPENSSPISTPTMSWEPSENLSVSSRVSHSVSVAPESSWPTTRNTSVAREISILSASPTTQHHERMTHSTVPVAPEGPYPLRDPYLESRPFSAMARYSFDRYVEEQERARRFARGEGTSRTVTGVPVGQQDSIVEMAYRRIQHLLGTVERLETTVAHRTMMLDHIEEACVRSASHAEMARDFAARERMLRQRFMWATGVLSVIVVVLVAVMLYLAMP